MEAILASNLTKKLGKKTVLTEINFRLAKGDRIGLIGPNGSGKTTLLKILSGLVPPSGGKVLVQSQKKELHINVFRKNIGLVSQEDSLDQTLNVRENLIYYGRYTGMNKESAAIMADQLLESMDLTSIKSSSINSLSSGTKKKIAILRCLMNSPAFIFMDEPGNHLDLQSRAWLKEVIASRPEKGFVLSSHDIDDIDLICNYVVLLYEGKIIAQGLSKELIEQHIDRFTLEFVLKGPYVNETEDLLQGHKYFFNNGRFCVFSNEKEELLKLTGQLHCSSLTLRESSIKDLYLSLLKKSRGSDD